MIRHMLCFSFRPAVSEADRQALLDDLAAFPKQFPKMKDLQIGRNISLRDDRFSHGMTVVFEHQADLIDYLDSEFHEHFVKARFRPLIAERAIVTLDV